MDQCTHEVRAEYWKGIIRACDQRPAGQSAKNWMRMVYAGKVTIIGSEKSDNRHMTRYRRGLPFWRCRDPDILHENRNHE